MAVYRDTCPWAVEPEGHEPETIQKVKQPQSTVQSLLYGGDLHNSAAPQKSGKKSILPPTVRPSPFAQWNVETQEQYPQEFFPRGRKDRGSIDNQSQYKVGSAGFNPSDYRANLESNYYNRHSSKERAHGDYNLLSHKGQESPGAAPTASGEKVGFAASKTAFPQSP